jgi:BlaI family penicillinase repressor
MYSDKKGSRKPLSPVEHLVMNVIWQKGSASTEDVRQSLSDRHPMKESTARTVLKRLEGKGYLEHRVDGRTNIYSGREAPDHVAARGVRQIVDRLCGGSVERLLVGMVENEVVDARELSDLARKIARMKARKEE